MTRIVVVDNHGQFTHLEHRTLRDIGVDVETVDNETPPAETDADGYVLSGGPSIDRTGRAVEYLDADEVVTVPPGFERTATSDICGVEAMSDTERDLYGVQWHPEVAHTERGVELFENFVARCERAAPDTA